MTDKLFLVTGASSGIGYQITLDLLLSGSSVLGVSRNISVKITKLLADYPAQFFFESIDLIENIDALSKWVLSMSKQYGKFSGFVHSAGIQQVHPLQNNSYAHMIKVFDLNVFAAFALVKGITDKRVVAEHGGSIVFLSSIASKIGEAGLVNYSASKAALNGAMRAMAKELAPRNIRVNSVLPGFVLTEMIEKWKEIYNTEYIESIDKSYPLGLGKPKDVSNMVLFLLSNQSEWVTGCEFNINGGATLGGQE